jgi:hypothetical protein
MDVDSLFGSNPKSIKRTFFEALHEFSQQTSPAPKKPTIEPTATDTIRVEVNKVDLIVETLVKNIRFSILVLTDIF